MFKIAPLRRTLVATFVPMIAAIAWASEGSAQIEQCDEFRPMRNEEVQIEQAGSVEAGLLAKKILGVGGTAGSKQFSSRKNFRTFSRMRN